jgi:hypothetical protein
VTVIMTGCPQICAQAMLTPENACVYILESMHTSGYMRMNIIPICMD